MTDTLDTAIAAVVGVLDAIDDHAERQQKIVEAEERLEGAFRELRQRLASQIHETGKPWREVGAIMGGVTAQRAWQISRGE